jgi:hypothetical protein
MPPSPDADGGGVALILPQPERGTIRATVALSFYTRQFTRQDHRASHIDLIDIFGI